MKPGFAEIICIIDRSGSMNSIKSDAIGGFNAFLEEQKKLPSEANLTYIQFDTEYEVVHENKPLKAVDPIDKNVFIPRGATALLDAIGKTLDATGKRLAHTPEKNKPEKVIVVILTDGHENASTQYNQSKIKEMISHQREQYSWEFIFLAANQDAFSEATKIGIDAKNSFDFAATNQGIKDAYAQISHVTANFREL
ncbi:VWA domain-containing protein [Spirulina subsalsa CS-330]|nr:VWA domain-containing protein [Spirulina subsalsa CS-330]